MHLDGDLLGRDGFAADGAVRLDGAHIAGLLDLTEARFRNPDGDAINAVALRIDGDAVWHPAEVNGRLNLAFAYARVWRDNAIGRTTPTVLRGFRSTRCIPVLTRFARGSGSPG